jgi:hypothetical protein
MKGILGYVSPLDLSPRKLKGFVDFDLQTK